MALCCGPWRIEVIALEGRQVYRVTRGGVMYGRGYLRTVEQVREVLARQGGPDLGEFEECE